uniref:Uncharacterized protein n=1 Tax=Oryctolagus cuniculus TaxID=9986 RepID=G1U1B6_RABIT
MSQQYYPDGHSDYAYQQSPYTEQSYDRSFEESTQHYYEGGNSQYSQQQAGYQQGGAQQQSYSQQQYPNQQSYPGQQQAYGKGLHRTQAAVTGRGPGDLLVRHLRVVESLAPSTACATRHACCGWDARSRPDSTLGSDLTAFPRPRLSVSREPRAWEDGVQGPGLALCGSSRAVCCSHTGQGTGFGRPGGACLCKLTLATPTRCLLPSRLPGPSLCFRSPHSRGGYLGRVEPSGRKVPLSHLGTSVGAHQEYSSPRGLQPGTTHPPEGPDPAPRIPPWAPTRHHAAPRGLRPGTTHPTVGSDPAPLDPGSTAVLRGCGPGSGAGVQPWCPRGLVQGCMASHCGLNSEGEQGPAPGEICRRLTRSLASRPPCLLRACPGSPLAVLRLPAGTRPAVRKLQSVTGRTVLPAAAALRLRAGPVWELPAVGDGSSWSTCTACPSRACTGRRQFW